MKALKALWILPLLPFIEGSTMGIQKIFHGLAGSMFASFEEGVLAVFIVAALQIVIGSGAILSTKLAKKEETLFVPLGHIFWFLIFGVFAEIATIYAFLAFSTGAPADMTTITFIVSVLTIPCMALIGLCFKEKILPRQAAGSLIAVIAGILLLWPSSLLNGEMPLWIRYSFYTLAGAVGTATTSRMLGQRVKDGKLTRLSTFANIFVLQFWGGLTMFIISLGILLVFPHGREVLQETWTNPTPLLFVYSAIVTLNQAVWWSCRQLIFQYKGVTMLYRALPWLFCYLGIAMIGGIFRFGNAWSLSKGFGFGCIILGLFISEGWWNHPLVSRIILGIKDLLPSPETQAAPIPEELFVQIEREKVAS